MTAAHELKHPEIWRDVTDPNYSYFIIAVSAVSFYSLSQLCNILTPIAVVAQGTTSQWKWKNVSVSFVHSVICSFWTFLCFNERLDMAEDLITVYTQLSHNLVSFSVGYFLFDVLDLLCCQKTRQSFELLGHHAVIITCFMVPVWTRHYVGYAVVALMVEWNSIFLHFRQLLQIYGVSKLSSWYRLNSLTNLATFIVFRIILLSWMTRWIVINKDSIPLVFYTLGSAGLAVIVTMNIVLFYRLLKSDFISLKNAESDSKKMNRNQSE